VSGGAAARLGLVAHGAAHVNVTVLASRQSANGAGGRAGNA